MTKAADKPTADTAAPAVTVRPTPATRDDPQAVRKILSPGALDLLRDACVRYVLPSTFSATDKELHKELMAAGCMTHNGSVTHTARAVVALGQ